MRVIKNKMVVNRYETQSILSCIETLHKHDKQTLLFSNMFEKPLIVKFNNIKKQLQEIIRFKLFSKHYDIIKTAFAKYNIKITFPKRISQKRKANFDVIKDDHGIKYHSRY